ncbi:hypothetical protein F4815DRAFT_432042 [Daldinia loculata]|nr:hypothetical protein F4815DRAFT_432042 [Daldinia loculata]
MNIAFQRIHIVIFLINLYSPIPFTITLLVEDASAIVLLVLFYSTYIPFSTFDPSHLLLRLSL